MRQLTQDASWAMCLPPHQPRRCARSRPSSAREPAQLHGAASSVVLELVQLHCRKSAVTSRGAPREFEVPGGTPPLVREELESEHRVRSSVTPGRSSPGTAYREQPAGEAPEKNLESPHLPGARRRQGGLAGGPTTREPLSPLPGGAHPGWIGLPISEPGRRGAGRGVRTNPRRRPLSNAPPIFAQVGGE